MDTSAYPINQYPDIDAIMLKFDIQHDLRLKDKNKLIDEYFRYKKEKIKEPDHGIIGAVLFYNSLMGRDAEMERIADTAIMFSEKPLFGKENRDNIGLYVEYIARHNMWFASDKSDQCDNFLMDV